jgi:predicted RNA-binding protein YlxR (DUF448 family)
VVKAGKQRRKHVPRRTCVGCRTVNEKRALIRIVRTPEGVQIDPKGKLPGRGAYLHDNSACWQLGLDGRLAHALKITLSEQDRRTLAEFAQNLPLKDEEPQT